MSDVKETRKCQYCKIDKPFPEDYTSIRGKLLVTCTRCRGKINKAMHKYNHGKHRAENIGEKTEEKTVKKEDYATSQPVCYPPEIEIPELSEYIEIMKDSLQSKLCRYSKKKILQFFENSEPEIHIAFEHIESEELKDLIKIYMNAKYLESIR